MTQIPSGQKILTVSSTVDTNEKKSTQANSPSQYYTIGDIAETLTGSANLPTTTAVNILSAQILAMGSSPIELLPQPGANKYYDIEKIVLEYTHVTTAYTATVDEYVDFNYGNIPFCSLTSLIGTSNNSVQIINSLVNSYNSITVGGIVINNTPINQAIIFGTLSGNNPTDGDGTLRAIITYTIRTFGA